MSPTIFHQHGQDVTVEQAEVLVGLRLIYPCDAHDDDDTYHIKTGKTWEDVHAALKLETATCRWCSKLVVDGREESGYTGEGPDWMLPDGDFGCDPSPETGEDGVGSHAVTDEQVMRAIRWACEHNPDGVVRALCGKH